MAPLPSKPKAQDDAKQRGYSEVKVDRVGEVVSGILAIKGVKKCLAWGFERCLRIGLESRIHKVVEAISEVLEGSGLTFRCCAVDVSKVCGCEHELGHARRPFQDLGANVPHEGGRAPSSENHYFYDGTISQEEGHGGSGSKGVGAYVHGGVAEGTDSAAQFAS